MFTDDLFFAFLGPKFLETLRACRIPSTTHPPDPPLQTVKCERNLIKRTHRFSNFLPKINRGRYLVNMYHPWLNSLLSFSYIRTNQKCQTGALVIFLYFRILWISVNRLFRCWYMYVKFLSKRQVQFRLTRSIVET